VSAAADVGIRQATTPLICGWSRFCSVVFISLHSPLSYAALIQLRIHYTVAWLTSLISCDFKSCGRETVLLLQNLTEPSLYGICGEQSGTVTNMGFVVRVVALGHIWDLW